MAKFNLSGTLLAFHCTASMRTNHEIIVISVNQLQVTHNLVGHLGIVYDLDWLNDSVLVSVSTDRTAIVWYLTLSNFKMKVCSYTFYASYCIHIFLFEVLTFCHPLGFTPSVVCLCMQMAEQIYG